MTPLLESKSLVRSFEMGESLIEVLKGIDFSLEKGEMVGVVGASGSGKSTLLHILGGLDRPSAGGVFFKGEEIYRLNEKGLADFRNRKVGFVFQFHQLLGEFTALENVILPAMMAKRKRAEAEAEAVSLLERVGLKHRIYHRPGKLSGGEQQRVAIARGLINKPDLLLADEPTGNLDSRTGEEIHELLSELNEGLGQTCVIVTHNTDMVKKMSRFIRLADGKIV